MTYPIRSAGDTAREKPCLSFSQRLERTEKPAISVNYRVHMKQLAGGEACGPDRVKQRGVGLKSVHPLLTIAQIAQDGAILSAFLIRRLLGRHRWHTEADAIYELNTGVQLYVIFGTRGGPHVYANRPGQIRIDVSHPVQAIDENALMIDS